MDQEVNEGGEDNQNHCLINNANGTVVNSADESNDMDVEQGEAIILYYFAYLLICSGNNQELLNQVNEVLHSLQHEVN